MGNLLSLPNRLFKWPLGEPTIRQVDLQIVRIPADGSPPHLIKVNTIESNDNVDCCMFHIPDFRPYWGKEEGFQWRDIFRMEVRDQSLPELEGIYFLWKSFAMDLMPVNKHTGWYGDAFVAKTPLWEHDENGAVYEDVPLAFLASPLLKEIISRKD